MSKTWLSVVTALVLVLLSAGVFLARLHALGTGGPRGAATWQVNLAVAGELTEAEASVVTVRPPDFRHQHVFEETFSSRELTYSAPRGRNPDADRIVWKKNGGRVPQPFRLTYGFRCLLGMRRPTSSMHHLTEDLDAPPHEGIAVKPSPRIESDDKEIDEKVAELVEDGMTRRDQLEAFYRFVAGLENEPAGGRTTALECLHRGGGDSAGKSRLLVALCRNHGIPARVVNGVVLVDDLDLGLHSWAEAWADGRWLPMCPTYGHFDSQRFPGNYLVLGFHEDVPVHGSNAQFKYTFRAHNLNDPFGVNEDRPPTKAQAFWQSVSLYALRPAEQHLVRFMLLLPLAALVVTVCRTVIGVPTFGTFAPALLGLAFLDLKVLRWALGIFILTVLVGWGLRRALDRFHLLMVSRVSILLTLIVMFLIAMIVVAGRWGVGTTQYIALFPLVILTHLVERFWTVETEDGTLTSFKTLLGTIGVSVAISVSLSPHEVTVWMFRHPETLGVVLAAQFLLGRYTGYRLTELYRFQDLIVEEKPRAGAAA